MTVWVVVVAAGSGRRFGAPKQFAPLGGRPWCNGPSRPAARGRRRGARAPCRRRWRHADRSVSTWSWPGGDTRRVGARRAGGGARVGRVIVVHDGARPLASPALFRAVVDAVAAGADAAVPAVAVADTLKRSWATRSPPRWHRDGLVAVADAPGLLGRRPAPAPMHAEPEATDDAGLVESLGATVRVVPGDPRNIKVTTATDLDVVRALVAP